MRLKQMITILSMLGIMLLSCSSSDEGQGNGEFIVASVEGIFFETSTNRDAVFASKIDGGQSITFIVQGVDDLGSAMVLTISDYEGIGTYDLIFDGDANSANLLYSTQETAFSSNISDGGEGSITVTTDTDLETSGTFEFVVVEVNASGSSRTVTNGRFNADFDN